MANLQQMQDADTGVIVWQCLDCGWESLPMDTTEAQAQPEHTCPPCETCGGTGYLEEGLITSSRCPDCEGKGARRVDAASAADAESEKSESEEPES